VAPTAIFPYEKELEAFRTGYTEPYGTDFFDQYLTFDSLDNENSIYPVIDNSTHLAREPSVGNSAGTASSHDEEHTGQSHHVLEHDGNVWDPEFMHHLASSPLADDCDDPSTTKVVDAASPEEDLLSLDSIHIHSPLVEPASLPAHSRSCSPAAPSSPPVQTTSPRRKRFLDTISRSLSIPKLRKAAIGSDGQQKAHTRRATNASPIRKVTQGHTARKVTAHAALLAAESKVKEEEEIHRLAPSRSPVRDSRKATSPAKMMRGAQYSDQSLEEWQARLHAEASKFDFGFSQQANMPSPPPSAKVSDSSGGEQHMMTASNSEQGAFTWDQPIPQYATAHSHDVHTPLQTPTFAPAVSLDGPTSNGVMYPSTPQAPTSSWAEVDQQFNPFVANSAFEQESSDAPLWWSQPPQGLQHQTPMFNHTSSDDTKVLAMQLQDELVYNASELALSPASMPQGLMIQMPQSPTRSQFVSTGSPLQHPAHPAYFSPTTPTSNNMPTGPRHRYTQSTPIPTASPLQFQTPQMRKSRSRAGDLSEPASPTSRTTSFQVQKRRNVSHNRAVSHGRIGNRIKSEHFGSLSPQKSPRKQGAAGGGFADFVNFTPSDSSKILTGVAPSGSSKTKARREKEAIEKRRKLSQAALKAIQAAGGDIGGLVEEGLLV
jgi:hypothetical protein